MIRSDRCWVLHGSDPRTVLFAYEPNAFVPNAFVSGVSKGNVLDTLAQGERGRLRSLNALGHRKISHHCPSDESPPSRTRQKEGERQVPSGKPIKAR